MKESNYVKVFSERHLKQGESVVSWCDGYLGKLRARPGALILTNERVGFYHKNFFGEILETIPLKSITSVERQSALGCRIIKLHTSNDSLAFNTFDKAADDLFSAIENGRSLSVTLPLQENNHLETLKKLAELKDAGVLSDAEFQNKKTELLAKL